MSVFSIVNPFTNFVDLQIFLQFVLPPGALDDSSCSGLVPQVQKTSAQEGQVRHDHLGGKGRRVRMEVQVFYMNTFKETDLNSHPYNSYKSVKYRLQRAESASLLSPSRWGWCWTCRPG